MRKLPLFLLFLLLFLTLSAAPVRALDPGGIVSPDRVPGVSPGAVTVYDHWMMGIHYTDTVRVENVTGSVVTFQLVRALDDGRSYNFTSWTDVNAQIFSTTQNASIFDYSKVGYSHLFVGSNVYGGPEYKGSSMIMTASIFGHIVLGNYRTTNYWDGSSPSIGWVDHIEWDRNTGILISYQQTYQDSGEVIVLKSTNLWGSNFFWIFMHQAISIASIVIPYLIDALLLYLFLFIVIGIYDWAHVRGARKKARGGKAPNPMWQQIKILIIAILIVMAIIYGILFLISLAIQHFGH